MWGSKRFTLFAFVLSGVAASHASGATLFDLRDVSIDSIDNVSSFTLTVDGISATLTAFAGGVTNPATVLNRTASGFGVNAVSPAGGPLDQTDQLDAINGAESVTIVFDQNVLFTQLVLSLYSTPTQVPPGDLANLVLPGGTVSPSPTTSAVDTYDLTTNNFVAAGQVVTLEYVQGNGFSFDSFSVLADSSARPTVTAIPLPPAAFSGMAVLGGLASAGFLRRRRRIQNLDD